MKYVFFFLLCFGLLACNGPEPRKPVEVKTGSFFRESIERSKKLLAEEEEQIRKMIEADSLHSYIASANGSWYYYETRIEAEAYVPRPDDLVTLSYALLNFENDTIYSADEIGVLTYKVDKQELFQGLRNSVKLLKEGETATFLYPSSLGYGYHGDNKKIGTNVPLKAILTVLKIEKQQDSIQN